ncbi:MAG: hypothetical protein IT439_09915 [Phycisphaerales bacterium]|nr:hypothetical protein [Phycisphaerales bacterium]
MSAPQPAAEALASPVHVPPSDRPAERVSPRATVIVPRSTRGSRLRAAGMLAGAIVAGAVPQLRAIPSIHAAGLVLIGAEAVVLLSRAARAPSEHEGPPPGFGACVPLIVLGALVGAASWAGLFVTPGGDTTPVFAGTGALGVIIGLMTISQRGRSRAGDD